MIDEFVMPGYVDLTITDVRTIARGCEFTEPSWLWADTEGVGELDSAGITESVASLEERGFFRRHDDELEIDAMIADAVELASAPSRALVVVSGSEDLQVSWIFPGEEVMAIFTRYQGSDEYRVRTMVVSALSRVVLRLTSTRPESPQTDEPIVIPRDTIEEIFELLPTLNDSPEEDVATQLAGFRVDALAERMGEGSNVSLVMGMKRLETGVGVSMVLWVSTPDDGCQLIEVEPTEGIVITPISTETLYEKIVESLP